MIGALGSGNRNFGDDHQRAAREIAAASGRPVLFECELSGATGDTEACRTLLAGLYDWLIALMACKWPDRFRCAA